MKLSFVKQGPGVYAPIDFPTESFDENFARGDVIRADFAQMRNAAFFRKWWTLVKFAYDHWDIEEQELEDMKVQKNMDRFRKDLTILAGHYDRVFNYKGELRLEAKSISWAKMSETEFQQFYRSTRKVVLDKILHNFSGQDLDKCLAQLETGYY